MLPTWAVSDTRLRMKWWRSGEKLNNLYVSEWTIMRKAEEAISKLKRLKPCAVFLAGSSLWSLPRWTSDHIQKCQITCKKRYHMEIPDTWSSLNLSIYDPITKHHKRSMQSPPKHKWSCIFERVPSPFQTSLFYTTSYIQIRRLRETSI